MNSNSGLYSLRPYHYHLGGKNYVTVVKCEGSVQVHLGQYEINETGELKSTERVICLPPSIWQHVVKNMRWMDLPSSSRKIVIVQDRVMLSTVYVEGGAHVLLQCYFQNEDYSRQFDPSICILSEREWEKLKIVHTAVTSSVISLMFGTILCDCIKKEVKERSPLELIDSWGDDAEMLLITSMIELLKTYLEENIRELVECYGCLEELQNPDDHECLTSNPEQRLIKYGNLALLNMNLESVAVDFVEKNINFVNYMSDMFLDRVNPCELLKNAEDLYVVSNHLSLF